MHDNSRLRAIADVVGPGFVRSAVEVDAIDGIAPQFVVEPGTPSEVARVLAIANENGLRVVPRGGNTKSRWGNPSTAVDVVLSLIRLNHVLEHAAGDMTATVEAGCTIASLQSQLAERGQRLALDPLWPEQSTVGGVLATADAGPLRWAFGPPRDLVLGVTVALADGTVARSGGKVVKNVAGYDLPKLFTGSFGTLGVITQATFRLHPLPRATRTLVFVLERASVGEFFAAMQRCSLITTAVQIRASAAAPTFADVQIEGEPGAIDSKVEQVTRVAVAAGAAVSSSSASTDVWIARQHLFENVGPSTFVCKIAIPPAAAIKVLSLLTNEETNGVSSQLVLQAYGVGMLRFKLPEPKASIVERLRSRIVELGGSLVILECPSAINSQLDVWGQSGDSLALMRRIKKQFDPRVILNPGRFVGGL